MKRFTRIPRIVPAAACLVALCAVAFTSPIRADAAAESGPPSTMGHAMTEHADAGAGTGHASQMGVQHEQMMAHHEQMMSMHASMGSAGVVSPGQDAFGAIQEIVRKLDADPSTDG